MVDTKLTTALALSEFFAQRIQEALEYQNIQISKEAEYYLVHILDHFSKTENLFQKNSQGEQEDRPLAMKLYDSVFSHQNTQKFNHLKSLGDTALYQAGVFHDGLQNQSVDLEYYIQMGGSAYLSLANMSTTLNATKAMADLFAELSEQFSQMVEVLTLCFEQDRAITDYDILKLIDRYQKTGSRKAKELLEEKGISPQKIITEKTVQ